MSSLQSRVLVAVIGVPVLVWVVLWAPPLVMLVALCLLAGIGGMELQRCVSGAPRSELVGMSAIFPVFMVAWYYERPEHVAVLVVVELVVFFGYAIVKGGEIKFNQIMAALFGGTFIGYSGWSGHAGGNLVPHRNPYRLYHRVHPAHSTSAGGRRHPPGLLAAAVHPQFCLRHLCLLCGPCLRAAQAGPES